MLNKYSQPKWVSTETLSKPIFTNTCHVGHPSITYNKALKRYILITLSDAVPHKENATLSAIDTWDIASELNM